VAGTSAPDPVKYFVAGLYTDAAALTDACAALVEPFGPIDFEGPDRPFDLTDYYEKEMGPHLTRRLLAFASLRTPEDLATSKLTCNRIEVLLATPTGRRVNLDVGYLDHNKIVLASAKGAGQKIYLRDGIFADLIARFAHGRYQPFEWTFPDFKDGRYDDELAKLRTLYLQQIKHWRR
jgi:Domain of unknown function (DUF4416)